MTKFVHFLGKMRNYDPKLVNTILECYTHMFESDGYNSNLLDAQGYPNQQSNIVTEAIYAPMELSVDIYNKNSINESIDDVYDYPIIRLKKDDLISMIGANYE